MIIYGVISSQFSAPYTSPSQTPVETSKEH